MHVVVVWSVDPEVGSSVSPKVKVDVGAPLEDVTLVDPEVDPLDVTLVDPEVGSSVSANVIVDVGASLDEPFNVGSLVDVTSDVGSFVEDFCVG